MEALEKIEIVGGRPLYGEVKVQGSKNAALPMMAAAILGKGVSVLKDCPRISDVFCMEEILWNLGARTWWEGTDLYVDAEFLEHAKVDREHAGRMRSSVILLGALSGRMEEGSIGYPGGCVIGKRPVDLHVQALRSLGVQIQEEGDALLAWGRPTGGCVRFPRKSVGATEQAVLAAACASGETVLENCAREPEIYWLCTCLKQMGAVIWGEGKDRIYIKGTPSLKPFSMRIPPDRIVAGTYILAGAASRGKVTLWDAPVEEMGTFLQVYRKMGGQYEGNGGKLIADSREICFPIPYLETHSYPGFPTDLQSPLLAVLAGIEGESVLCERIFEARYAAAEELKRMGACVEIQGQRARIHGKSRLTGAQVEARELRGGAALVVAGLGAQGETQVRGCQYICRGYEDICRDIACLGGIIERKPGET